MKLDRENLGFRTRKLQKPFGWILIAAAYCFLAAGIAVACLAGVPVLWRAACPIVGIALYGICGIFGYSLASDWSFSFNAPQRKREWKTAPKIERFLYAVTRPCTVIAAIMNFFNP